MRKPTGKAMTKTIKVPALSMKEISKRQRNKQVIEKMIVLQFKKISICKNFILLNENSTHLSQVFCKTEMSQFRVFISSLMGSNHIANAWGLKDHCFLIMQRWIFCQARSKHSGNRYWCPPHPHSALFTKNFPQQ